MILKYLLEKEFKMIRRDPFLPRTIVMMPLMVMLIFPWVGNMEVRDIKVCIADYDRSEMSRRLIAQIAASDYFVLTGVFSSHNEAVEQIDYGLSDSFLEIPLGFEAATIRNDRPQLFIASNSVNGVKGGLSNQYLTTILTDFPSKSQPALLQLYNPYLDYKIFMIPALMVMLLTIITGFLPALNIVGEKETGTIEQINVTPVTKLTFILSKLIPYWIIGFVILTICILIAAAVYGLTPLGSVASIYITATVYVLIISGLGLVVSNSSDTLQQAMFVMFFFMLVFILLSGLFTPTASMPIWAQELTRINPLKYFIDIIRCVYLKGSSFADILPQFLVLVLFAVLANVWAIASYRKVNG